MTKEGEGGQAENSSAKKEQGEQEMQEGRSPQICTVYQGVTF